MMQHTHSFLQMLTFLKPDDEACLIVPLTATSAMSMGAY
jgi:hypothetical protein